MGDLTSSDNLVPSAQEGPHSPASSRLSAGASHPSVHITTAERFYQAISVSYRKLTDMYSQLQQEKEQEVAEWKR